MDTLRAGGQEAAVNVESYPFEVNPDDHCETSLEAYSHIAPVLEVLAANLGKKKEQLSIFDPFYCAGGMKAHLAHLGFCTVYNEKEDFYCVAENQRIPHHDILVSNPVSYMLPLLSLPVIEQHIHRTV